MVRQRAGVPGISMIAAVCALVAAGAASMATVALHAQQQRFDLFVAAVSHATDLPVTDLTADDLVMTEDGRPGRVVRLERYSLPVKLTVLVDNAQGGADTLLHTRNALRLLLEALPGDLETEVIALSPNPRWLARPTTNRAELLRTVGLLVPEEFPGRFSDALVEYARRLERSTGDVADAGQAFLPVLVALSTGGPDGSEARRDDLYDMLATLATRGVRTHVAVVSRGGDSLADGSQVLVGQAVRDLTRGQYEAIASGATSRVPTLLAEWGRQIAMTHRAGTSQYRVTLERPVEATGQITDLAMFVNREGYYGVVTVDGRVP